MDVFIREVRRPTGEQYLPESIYYLCLGKQKKNLLFFQKSSMILFQFLGIQFYLNINNRQIDLFDPRYFEFNSTLNKILQNYTPRLLTDSKSIDFSLLFFKI
jgi:hypothetical protein